MNSWNKRTREVAHLLNPAFCGRMLYSAINAYSIKTKRAFPFPLVYLQPARKNYPISGSTTGMVDWAVI